MIKNQFSKQAPDEGALPRYDLGPGGRTPRLALVANLHGNELNGMFVLARLAAFLKSIESGEQDGLRLRERVVIIPTMHDANLPIAAIPRRERSGVMERRHHNPGRTMLETVATLTRTAYYRVDLHSTAPEIEEMPQVRLYAPSDDERASACLFGLPAVIERPAIDDAASGLVRAWRAHGGENFVIHAGQAGNLQTGHCETLFRALAAFLDRTGIVSGLRPVDDDEDLRYFGLQQVMTVAAEQSGLFASGLEVGCWVRTGEVLGQIYDSLTGGIQAEVVAPVAGLLASLRRQPLLQPGDLVARLLTPAAAVQRRSARLGERHGRWASRRA
ncbi:MAG: succinylglutamate desuccinylase/aspartoacylase family protein [Candidatus Contendobacter sp.]|nr:succinylglutamate desuccinylase/aspartoacylase family protein [Gammaproteobacteria bacterium]MCC8993593.1 succinylglutamate desuccinylase/aspartoacylase family protein [Candidatus Contendobacter sp.]